MKEYLSAIHAICLSSYHGKFLNLNRIFDPDHREIDIVIM